MKLLDEQGRLFKKINLIDFFALVFLISLIPIGYLGHKVFTARPKEQLQLKQKEEFVDFAIDCQLIKLRPQDLENISAGDQELAENGQSKGVILGLGEIEPYIDKFYIGEEIIKKDSGLKQRRARLKLKAEIKNRNLYYNNQEITPNSELQLNINSDKLLKRKSQEVNFTIEQQQQEQKRIVDVNIMLKDLDNDTIKGLAVGAKELDANGEPVVEILSLGKIEKNSIVFNLGEGNFTTGEDSSKRQVCAQARLKCEVEQGDRLYFKGQEIKQNSTLEFKLNGRSIKGVLARTFDVAPEVKKKWVSVQVKFSGISPEVANAIQKGDVEKEVSNTIVGRISAILENKPAQILTLKEKEFTTLNHPFLKDILAVIDVECIEKDGVFYFKNYPVKMGNSFVFSTRLYSLSGVIVGMRIE